VVDIVVEAARGRIPVVAGTGSNSTREAIGLTQHAAASGAAGALVVNPYYNKPTQEGLYRHFRAVAESSDLPILVYNIQGRTAVNVETDTMARLVRDCPNIVGVKEASGSLDQMTQVILACGPDFTVLSGDDNITLPLMSVGGRGVVSVIANIVPRDVADMTHAALDGDWKRARDLHLRLFPLSRAAFLETNPIPIKEAMAMAGMIEPEFRLPMCRMSDGNREKLRSVIRQFGLVK
jgi:4-hydroxy-tetrahydrodipicolinate synthase